MIGDKNTGAFPSLKIAFGEQICEGLVYGGSRNPESRSENSRGRHTGRARIKTAALEFFSYLAIQLLVKRLGRRTIQAHQFERHD